MRYLRFSLGNGHAFSCCATLISLLFNFSNASELSQRDVKIIEKQAVLRIGNTTTAIALQANVRLIFPNLENEIQSLVYELAVCTDTKRTYRVNIINDAVVNAFAVPSGDIFVYSGLLSRIENRDELAFVLGHEIAHIQLEHSLKKLNHTLDTHKVTQFVATILVNLAAAAASSAVYGTMMVNLPNDVVSGVAAPASDKGVEVISNLVGQLAGRVSQELIVYAALATMAGYSREKEYEADQWGLACMEKAGYNKNAAIDALRKLNDNWHIEKPEGSS